MFQSNLAIFTKLKTRILSALGFLVMKITKKIQSMHPKKSCEKKHIQKEKQHQQKNIHLFC